MLSTAFTQLRYAYSIVSGRRFSTVGMRKIVRDLQQTLDEFGEPTREAYELLAGSGEVSPEVRQNIAETRLRRTVREAASQVPYYHNWFAGQDVDIDTISAETFPSAVPVTVKSAVRAAPFAFVSRRSQPVLLAQTTGTSGVPVSVWFSSYEMELLSAGTALSFILLFGLRRHHIVASCVSSRATFNHVNAQQWTALVGAAFIQLGTVDPRLALDRLAAPLHIPGKEPQITHLVVSPSYLSCLIQEAEESGMSPQDFGLQRIYAGGEILTNALRSRAQEVLGAPIVETYSATEILPVSALVCSQQHLHFSPESGYLEILDPRRHSVTAPGDIGSLTFTPYFPYRESTILLRYETGDLVRRLDDRLLTCEFANLPATSLIMGRAGVGAESITRDLLEILQAERCLPLPTRYAIDGGAAGRTLYVVAGNGTRALASRLEDQISMQGFDLSRVIFVPDQSHLPESCLLRSDLREASFEALPQTFAELDGSLR